MGWRKVLCLIVFAGLSGAGAGCVGLDGVAGTVGYTPNASRSSQDYPSTFRDSWYAAQLALGDLRLNIESEQNNGASGTLTSRTQNGAIITITIATQPRPIPVDGIMTRISVRVGTFGDQETSDRILGRIGERLAARTATTQMLPPNQTPAWQKPVSPSATPIVISPSVPGTLRRP